MEEEKEEEEGGGVKGAPENSCTNSYVVTTNTYLSPFLKVHAHRPWFPPV